MRRLLLAVDAMVENFFSKAEGLLLPRTRSGGFVEVQIPQGHSGVGEVDDADLDRVHEILKSVWIDKSESSGWNCQDWSLDGFAMLQQEGFIYDYLTHEAIKSWLKEVEGTTASDASASGGSKDDKKRNSGASKRRRTRAS